MNALAAAIVVFVAGAGAGGAASWHYRSIQARAEVADAAQRVADATRQAFIAEGKSALAAAKKADARRAKARDAQHRLELELARDEAARTCRVSDRTLGVLNDTIDAANDLPAAAGRGDGALPAVAAPGRADRGGFDPLGLIGRIGLRRVPSQTPATEGVD